MNVIPASEQGRRMLLKVAFSGVPLANPGMASIGWICRREPVEI